MRKLLFIMILAGIFSACEKNLVNDPLEEMIIGNWSEMQSHDTIHTLKKFNSLPDDDYAIAFMQSGQLKENKNSGWCGTPPVSYSEIDGSWEIQDDSTVFIESSYWGGDLTMTWRIIDIDNTELSYYILESYYEELGDD